MVINGDGVDGVGEDNDGDDDVADGVFGESSVHTVGGV